MKKVNKFKVGDIVSYNNRGKNLVSHEQLRYVGKNPAEIVSIKGNNATVMYKFGPKSVPVIAMPKVHIKYLDMIKASSRHPLTSIFSE